MAILIDKEGEFDLGENYFVSWSFRLANQLFTTTTHGGTTLRHYINLSTEHDGELVVTQVVLPFIHMAVGVILYPASKGDGNDAS